MHPTLRVLIAVPNVEQTLLPVPAQNLLLILQNARIECHQRAAAIHAAMPHSLCPKGDLNPHEVALTST